MTFSMPIVTVKLTKFFFLLGLFIAALVFSARVMSPVAAQTDDFGIGTIDEPPGVAAYNQAANVGEDESALLFFVSRMIRAVAIGAGLWTLVNVGMAAFTYITGQGNANSHEKVRNLLTYSAIGMILIVSAYTIGGILGLIFFGDAAFLLNPTF